MVKPTDRSQAVSALILRLTERQQIKWMAPDKDNVLHQMVDAGDLADAITALTLFAHALSTPSPDSGERMREALEPFAGVAVGEVWKHFSAENPTLRISSSDGSRHLTFVSAEWFERAAAALQESAR